MTIAQGELVFVPDIGFRSAGTRTLREPVETVSDGTTLRVLAVAAAPERTDVVVEWQRTGDPAECPPGSTLLSHQNTTPLEKGVTAAVIAGASQANAVAMRRQRFQMSYVSIGAIDGITFPAVPRDARSFELRMAEGPRSWRLTVPLAPAVVGATALSNEVVRGGVAIRVTAVTQHKGQTIVGVEVEAPHQIRQVAGPIPSPARFSDTSERDQRERTAEMRKHFGATARPLLLETESDRVEEAGRLFTNEPQQLGPGRFVTRFVAMFDVPDATTGSASLVVPFVDLNDFSASAMADLRNVPREIVLGEHRFRVVSVEAAAQGQRVAMERPTSDASPRFMQPARMYGSDPETFAWLPDEGTAGTFAMTTTVGDPPIVTFKGVVLRVDGPLVVPIASLSLP